MLSRVLRRIAVVLVGSLGLVLVLVLALAGDALWWVRCLEALIGAALLWCTWVLWSRWLL